MEANQDRHGSPPAADWLRPPIEEEGLSRYVRTLRERIWIVVAAVAITTGVAILYVLTATKMYEAEADLLVTPVPATDTPSVSLSVIRESADPTRDVATAAKLVTNVGVATRVRQKLHVTASPQDLLAKVSAAPVSDSDIVAVTARADSPTAARDLANAFASQAVAERTAQLHKQIDQIIPSLEARIARSHGGQVAASLQTELSQLVTLRSGPDPTMHLETPATTPTSAASPRPVLSIAGGLFAGIVLGVGIAFASQVLDPLLRREEQLRRLYGLPILARVPKEPRGAAGKPLSPAELTSAAAEAYRTLRGTLAVSRRRGSGDEESRAILITGSSPAEGKTTTAINLATSLAAAGNSVILIEADLRRPAIGAALDIECTYGIVSVLIESVPLQDALVTSPAFGSNLGMLLADYEGGWISELFTLPAAPGLLDDARRLADYVIVDSPPLSDVIDALPLATYVDEVLVVASVGKTNLSKLSQLGELLAENGIKPLGFAVLGVARPAQGYYYAPRDEGHGRLPRSLAKASPK